MYGSARLENETIEYKRISGSLNGYPRILREWVVSQRAARKSVYTTKAYLSAVKLLMEHLGVNDANFYKRITTSDIEDFMISLAERKVGDEMRRVGDDVIALRYCALSSFFGWLVKRGKIDTNPMDGTERPANNVEHKITYLEDDEVSKLLSAIDSQQDRVMYGLDFATGLRVSALANINLGDIDFEKSCVHVIEKRQKEREIPIGSSTMAMLADWIKVRKAQGARKNDPMFVSNRKTRMSIDTIERHLKAYCVKAGIKTITPHKARSTAAMRLTRAGVQIKVVANILGHDSIATTQRYVDAASDMTRDAAAMLDAVNN